MQMRFVGLGAMVIGLSTAAAFAQPSATPPVASDPAAPPPGSYPPAPAPACGTCTPPAPAPAYVGPAPVPVITQAEHELLLRGEISPGRYIGGGIVGTTAGFGIGHAVQGRWRDKGWIFTVGEGAATAVTFVGFLATVGCGLDHGSSDTTRDRCDSTVWMLGGGLIALGALRIWEIVDVWTAPPVHNRRVRDLRLRVGLPARGLALTPFVAPQGDRGGMAGLSLRF